MLATQYQFDVFLSYARKDADRAETLERELIACGLSVWRDVRGIDPAQDFTAEIENAIKASRSVVACITPDVERADSFVRRELGYAGYQRKTIYTVRYEEVPPPVSIFNTSWFDVHKDANAHARLCAVLKGDEAPPPAPITPPPNAPAADPFRESLEAILAAIVNFLNAAIPSEGDVIVLRSDATPQAVKHATPKLAQRFAVKMQQEGKDATPQAADKHFNSIHDALAAYQQRLLLLGEPGAGKTITLMATARNAIAARLADANAPLPLYADVATWDSENRQDFAEWFAEQYDVDAALIRPLIGTDGAMLFLDGLDELGDKRKADDGSGYDPRARFLEALPKTTPILLSCRVEEFKQIGQKAALRGAVTLEPLSDDQMQQYLAAEQAVWEALQADDKLREAFRTPSIPLCRPPLSG